MAKYVIRNSQKRKLQDIYLLSDLHEIYEAVTILWFAVH